MNHKLEQMEEEFRKLNMEDCFNWTLIISFNYFDSLFHFRGTFFSDLIRQIFHKKKKTEMYTQLISFLFHFLLFTSIFKLLK